MSDAGWNRDTIERKASGCAATEPEGFAEAKEVVRTSSVAERQYSLYPLHSRVVQEAIDALHAALLHHLRHDQTGFPRFLNPQSQDLFSRVVAIADLYDNATSPGRLTAEGMPPDRVMALLIEESGTQLDPALVKVFVQLMGLYPVGSMVRLDTGEVATVVEPPVDPEHLDRPRVRVVLDAGGDRTEREISLLERDPIGGFVRSIIKIYQQAEVELEVGEFLSVL